MKNLIVLFLLILPFSGCTLFPLSQYSVHYRLRYDFDLLDSKGISYDRNEKLSITENYLKKLLSTMSKKYSLSRKDEDIIVDAILTKDPAVFENVISSASWIGFQFVGSEFNNSLTRLYEKDRSLDAKALAKKLNLPRGYKVLYYNDLGHSAPDNLIPIVVLKDIILDGSYIDKAYVTSDSMKRGAVGITFTAEGTRIAAEMTARENYGRQVAIVINDRVISYPSISSTITDGHLMILGNFTTKEVSSLAEMLNSFKIGSRLLIAGKEVHTIAK